METSLQKCASIPAGHERIFLRIDNVLIEQQGCQLAKRLSDHCFYCYFHLLPADSLHSGGVTLGEDFSALFRKTSFNQLFPTD
jgi:hypothetical protein